MKFLRMPTRRRLVALAILPLTLLVAYGLWRPGVDIRDGRHDLSANGIWMQHGWLGDNDWFIQNHKDDQIIFFREPARLAALAAEMHGHHIRYVFPHLCPARSSGAIAPSDAAQVERFLDVFEREHIEVLPWVGGVRGASARPDSAAWRQQFVQSCTQLLLDHPRLAGIHVNIEPMPSGDPDFLVLLEALRGALPPDKKISVAAYPPPTVWQRMPEVHWDEAYSRAVAARVDQAVVMMYDTSLQSSKLYEKLVRDWTSEVLTWYAPTQVLLGVPAYDDAGVGYHEPGTENLENALAGIHAGLGDPPAGNYAGVSIYCEWEMTPEKWRVFSERFASRP